MELQCSRLRKHPTPETKPRPSADSARSKGASILARIFRESKRSPPRCWPAENEARRSAHLLRELALLDGAVADLQERMRRYAEVLREAAGRAGDDDTLVRKEFLHCLDGRDKIAV